MFEFDFLDRKNKEDFLYFRPVQLQGENYRNDEQLTAQNVIGLIRKAATPYTADLARKMA
jgi:hypothetical protein